MPVLNKPVALAGVSDLDAGVGSYGRGVRVLQIEFDIFDDHECIKPKVNRIRVPSKSIERATYFRNVKRTIHATAVASVIVSNDYGIAKDACLRFAGGSAKYVDDAEIVLDTLERVIQGQDGFALRRGDIITISLQRDVIPVRKAPRPVKVPIDTHDAVQQMIRYIAEQLGVLVFIAAGNSGRNLETLQYRVTDLAGTMTIGKRTFGEGRDEYDAFLVGALAKSNSPSSYSNYGSCVDFFFPAAALQAACYHDTTEAAALIGSKTMGFGRTSAATPAVAGVFANVQSYLISKGLEPLGPLELRNLVNISVRNELIKQCCGHSIFPEVPKLIDVVDKYYEQIFGY